MAESMVTDPIYLDETAKANGAKLDLLNATMLGVSASLGVLAKAQTGIFEEMDYNAIKAVVDAGSAPITFPTGTQGRQSLRLPVGCGAAGRYRRGRERRHGPGNGVADALCNLV